MATSHRDRLVVLDGWRGCAILLLLAGHFIGFESVNLGRAGVELFFVLSGRLMAEILFVQKSDLLDWSRRRVARLVPALWVFLAIMYVASQVFGGQPLQVHAALSGATFTFNHAYGVQSPPSLQHIWSLCVEVHAYFALAAVAYFMRNRPLKQAALVLLALAFGAMIWGVVQTVLFDRGYYDVYWRSDVRGASIVVSAGVFLVCRHMTNPWISIVCALLGLGLQFDACPDVLKYTLGTSLLAIAVATLPNTYFSVRNVLSARILCWFGLTSYSIYIWQQPFAHSGLPWVVGLAAALACGTLSYYFVERPLRRKFMTVLARPAKQGA